LVQFNFLTLKLHGFDFFNQVLLNLFNVSNAFHDNFLVNIKEKLCPIV